MTVNIFLFNAPPDSGKDYACEFLVNKFKKSYHTEFKKALYDEVGKFFNVESLFIKRLNSIREYKEIRTPFFDDLSLRGAMIKVSEDIIKPKYGDDFFGKKALEFIDELVLLGYKNIFFSDSGFIKELNPIADKYQCHVIKLHRHGRNFNNDSRNYLDLSELNEVKYKPTESYIFNSGKYDFLIDCENLVKGILNESNS